MKLTDAIGAVPLWIKIAVAIALVAGVLAGIRGCTTVAKHKTNAAIEAAEGKGAATAAATAATKGLERVEKGNKAAAAVDRDDDARRAGCLRHSRTPENC